MSIFAGGFVLRNLFFTAAAMTAAVFVGGCTTVKLLTLDPGHFHAALVQKTMYPGVDTQVHVYAPGGEAAGDLQEHLKRVEGFNGRAADPTKWQEVVYTGPDYLDRMLAEKKGNVVVIAGNNQRKTEYILKSVKAGLNVLADKPMAINPAEFVMLKEAFAEAKRRDLLLYDIMTERFEIWSVLQRELMQIPEVFGALEPGSAADPTISMESIHYFSKVVAGSQLKRPAWFFDVRQQGEGIVDVSTHLVDLVQWEAYPGVPLQESDVTMLSARRFATPITKDQLSRVTGGKPGDDYPEFLKRDVVNGVLQVYSNGEFTYKLKGIHARVMVRWDFETANGGDTHFSRVRGTKATLTIRQGAEQSYKPMLYVDSGAPGFEATLTAAVARLAERYPGIGVRRQTAAEAAGGLGGGWAITVPARYDTGHEAHFGAVTSNFLEYLRKKNMPAWEIPNMITKYSTVIRAYEMSHQ